MSDRRLGLVLGLAAVGWLVLVFTQIPDVGAEGEPGPRGFPILLGFVLAALGAALVAQDLRAQSDAASDRSAPRETIMAAGTFALLLLYAFLLNAIGFLAATPLVLLLTTAGLLRLRTGLTVLSLAVGFTAVCWMVFAGLGTPLPAGTWTVLPTILPTTLPTTWPR